MGRPICQIASRSSSFGGSRVGASDALRRAALALVCFAGTSATAQTFTGLGSAGLSGPWGISVAGISADGSVLVGWHYPGGTAYSHAYRWSATDGLQDLGSVLSNPAITHAESLGVSGDGSTVIGDNLIYSSCCPFEKRAFRWTSATGSQDLGTLPGSNATEPYAISGDGQVIVGLSFATVDPNGVRSLFSWTTSGGIQPLTIPPSLPGYTSRPTAMNGDGTVVVGGDTWRAFRWTSAGGSQALISRNPGRASQATGVSNDGSVVVGESEITGSGLTGRGFRWTAAQGMVDLGALPEGSVSRATGVSGDGKTVVGLSSGDGGPVFVWNSTLGMVGLVPYLQSLGADLSGWSEPFGPPIISADGLKVAGFGQHNGQREIWIATIPPEPCLSIQGIHDQSVCAGTPVTIDINGVGSGDGPYTFQWRKGGVPIDTGFYPSAATASLDLGIVAPGDAGEYDCVVTNSCATATSDVAHVTVSEPLEFTTQPTDVMSDMAIPAEFHAAISGGMPAYQWQWMSPIFRPDWQNASDGSNIYYNDGFVTPLFDATGAYGTTFTIRRSPDCYFTIADFAGFSVRCVVTNECGEFFSDAAQLIAANAWIVQHPADVVSCPNADAPFTVVAGGEGPFTYQWETQVEPEVWTPLVDGAFIANPPEGQCATVQGSDSDSMTVSSFNCWPVGYYPPPVRCVVTNSLGAAASNPAWLYLLDGADPSCPSCPACPADYDNNGGVDGGDLAAFFTDFEAGTECADVDANGGVDGGDLAHFFLLFEAGGC